ncbi:MAG TPA: SsrA-binding protein SmpB [Frankiaceae bacterium]|nr:SsrA-binding protein SmpB [Frankiaceae bacterium]
MPRESGRKMIAQNRRARHDFAVIDTYEAGVVLQGTEVKSLREGRANITEAFAQIDNGEAWLHNAYIPEYTQGTYNNHSPRRRRKLLLHGEEIERLVGKTRESGLTLVPLALYFSNGRAKVEIALARGKRAYDRRQDLAEREANREMQRAIGRRSKGMD